VDVAAHGLFPGARTSTPARRSIGCTTVVQPVERRAGVEVRTPGESGPLGK